MGDLYSLFFLLLCGHAVWHVGSVSHSLSLHWKVES